MQLGGARKVQVAPAIAALLLLCTPLSASAYRNYNSDSELTQESAQTAATRINNNGSDDSEDDGIKHGTIALNCVAALNIGCAFQFGYKGYGNYINSQKLNDLHHVTRRLDGSMASVGYEKVGNGENGTAGSSNGRDSALTGKVGQRRKWADKDRAFLYKGEMNTVAEEFEKKSGMSREELFRHIADAADANMSWDDPELLNKLEQRYQNFVARVPNKDFKANLERVHSMFDIAKKLGLMEEAKDFYVKNRYGDRKAARVAAQTPAAADEAARTAEAKGDGSPAALAATGPTPAGIAPADGGASRAPASNDEALPKLKKDEMGMYLGLENSHQNELREVLQGTPLALDGESIFKVVSRRYRKLTPALLGKANVVVNSK